MISRRFASTLSGKSLQALGINPQSKEVLALGSALQKLQDLEDQFKLGGGPRGLHRHCVLNKKVAPRKRLEMLFDHGKFYEVNRLAGYGQSYGDIPAAGAISAFGLVNGRLCLVSTNDATVKGGTIYPIGVKKSLRAQEIAFYCRLPTLHLVDSGGAFLPLQAEIFPDSQNGGRVFYNEALLNSQGVTQLALVLGSSTAGGAYLPMMSDEVAMVDKISQVFLGGPPLVQAALGEIVTAEELGGAALHSHVSGCSDHFVLNEAEGFALMRELVTTIPHQSHSPSSSFSAPLYRVRDLDSISINDLPEDQRRDALFSILGRVVDASALIEYKPTFSHNLICAFARLHGRQIGVLGSWNNLREKDAVKGAQFIEICSHRKIPLVFLIHTVEDSANDESGLTLRAKATMMSLVAAFKLPKISVLIGNASGADYWLMCGKSLNPAFILAWPNARIDRYGSQSWDEASEMLVQNPTENRHMDAFSAAGNLYVDDVLRPSDTREHVAYLMDVAYSYADHNNDASMPSQPILRF